MNKNPSSQLLRFLKAYYKITNKNITNIEHFEHRIWLDCLKNNKHIIVPSYKSNTELIIINLPTTPECVSPNRVLESLIVDNFCDPQISNVDLLKNINLSDYIDDEFNKSLEGELNDYLQLRSIWLDQYHEYQTARKLYYELESIYSTYQNSSYQMSLILGNGLLQLDKDNTNICFPLIHQPVSIEKNNNSFTIKRIESAYLCTDTLTTIPGISPSAIENSIATFESKDINLPSGNQLNVILADIFKNITTGNQNSIRLNDSPVLFLSPHSKPYSSIISKLMRNQKNNALDTSLDSFLRCNIPNTGTDNKTIDYSSYFLIKNDQTSTNIINTLENEQLCLVQAPAGTDYYTIVANTIGHYLTLGKNILVIEPSQRHISTLKEHLPKQLTAKTENEYDTENGVSVDQKNNILVKYFNAHSELENMLSKINDFSISANNENNITYNDNNQLYWSEDAVYRRGLLTDVLSKTENLLSDNFTNFPFAKLIADQNKIDVLRINWQKLIKLIDDYRLFNNSATKTLYRVKIELNMLLNLNSALATVDEILDFLKRKKKLRKIDYTFSRNWKNLINSCSINKKQPQTLNDFLLVKIHIEKSLLKTNLRRLWAKMMVPIGLPKLASNDKDLDLCLNKYYQIMVDSINWYEVSWKPFIIDLLATGFRWKEFFNLYAQQYIEHDLIDTLANYALSHLKELISERIKYTQEELLCANSDLETLNSINLEQSVVDITPHLVLVNELKNNIDSFSAKAFNSINQGKVTYQSYQQFLKKISVDSADIYDLIIINNCEKLDIFSVLALGHTEKCLVIGDEYQNYDESNISNLDTITELGMSLLSGFKNNFSVVNSSNLYEFLKGNCISDYYLSNNSFNPLAIVNCLNKICYDNKLNYLGNNLADSMMTLNVTELINSNISDLTPYISSLIYELSCNIAEGKSIAVVDIQGDYYFELNSELADRDYNNVYVCNINGLANLKFDIVLALDLCTDYAKITKYDNTIRAELCTLLGCTKEFFCYIHNANSLNYLLPLQNELVDYIDNSSISNELNGYSNSVVSKIIDVLKSYKLNYYKNILVNNLEIDLVIDTAKQTLLIDKRKILGLQSSLVDSFLSLNKNGINIVLVDFEEDDEILYSKLADLLDLESCVNIQNSIIDLSSTIKNFNQNWYFKNSLEITPDAEKAYRNESTDVTDKPEININEAIEDKLIITKKQKDTETIKNDRVKSLSDIFSHNSTNIKYSFNDSDLNNKAALYNFSSEDDLEESFGFELTDSRGNKPIIDDNSTVTHTHIVKNDQNIKTINRARANDLTSKQDLFISHKSNIISDEVNITISESASTLSEPSNNEQNTAFDPENDTYNNLYFNNREKATVTPSTSDFNLINWLKNNRYEYYDFRPDGKLYIIDTPKMRSILRSLRSKGYYFTLSLSNSQLPENRSAWILK